MTRRSGTRRAGGGEWLLLRDGRRASWVLGMPTHRFVEHSRAEAPARLRPDREPAVEDLAPLEQFGMGTLILFWFASLSWVLWHLLACD